MAVPAAASSVRRVIGDVGVGDAGIGDSAVGDSGDVRALKILLSFVRTASTISPVIDAGAHAFGCGRA
ncbi:hypothetical protein GCM10027074_07430 [Streptomyces deserti]